MSQFLTSNDLDDISREKAYDDLDALAASSCTGGYDNDGSTGFEIFENGFALAKEAGDKPIVAAAHGDLGVEGGTVFFFIGTLEGVTAKIEALPDANEEEEEEDDDFDDED